MRGEGETQSHSCPAGTARGRLGLQRRSQLQPSVWIKMCVRDKMYGHVAAGSAQGSNWSLNPAPGTPAGCPREEGITFYGQPKRSPSGPQLPKSRLRDPGRSAELPLQDGACTAETGTGWLRWGAAGKGDLPHGEQDAKAAAFCWAAGSWLLGAAPLTPCLPARALLLPPVLCCTSRGVARTTRPRTQEGFPSTARLDASIL